MQSAKTIFVSIASYRDKTCDKTVRSLLENAEFPSRVFIGTCEQNDLPTLETEACVSWNDAFFKPFYPQIRRVMISARDAEGPCYARYMCSLLYRGEDYFMQIDAHSLFVQHWDSICISLLESMPSPRYTILSYYPNPEAQYTPTPKPATELEVPVIKGWKKNNEGVLQWDAATYTKLTEPVASPYIAAGFFFVRGAFLQDVPFDPNLPYLFMGEELLVTIRAYTSGYDVYTPPTAIVFHRYQRHDEPSVYIDNAPRVNNKSAIDRVKRLTGIAYINHPSPENTPPTIDEDRYGLGKKRSCTEYLRLIGYIDATTEIPVAVRENFVLFPQGSGASSGCMSSYAEKAMIRLATTQVVCLILFLVLFIMFLLQNYRCR
jgi:hypothetical protein